MLSVAMAVGVSLFGFASVVTVVSEAVSGTRARTPRLRRRR
jgi:hypothetical protein